MKENLICHCFREKSETSPLSDFEKGVIFAKTGQHKSYVERRVTYCVGTKECDQCSCEGDRCKCDFYPEIAEKAKKELQEKRDSIELQFYRDYVFEHGLIYQALEEYEKWKKKQGK